MRKLKGIRLAHEKRTAEQAFVTLPPPQKVCIPMSMHMGAPCEPVVKLQQQVSVGECIGTSDAFFSADIHASISGKVTAITDYRMANGNYCKAVEITSDGLMTPYEGLAPVSCETAEEFFAAIRKSGAVGLGGAGFPTHVKLNPTHKIDYLIVNAAECEPYITSDDRTMQEKQEEIIASIRRVMQFLHIPECYIGVENNKPQAIKILRECAEQDDSITIVSLPPIYPQGAEKVMIYNITGRIVQEGQLPSEQGVIVINVSTMAFLEEYFRTGMPLVSRSLTIDGDAVNKPCNVTVPVGTSMREVLTYAECRFDDVRRLIGGGPMMGGGLPSFDMPITKTNNAILAFTSDKPVTTTACIRCGRCANVCPLNLMPTAMEQAYRKRDKAGLQALHMGLCMLCGCCSYVCPANRPLVESHRLAKDFLRQK
jgi:electron transport complex protein RnfC